MRQQGSALARGGPREAGLVHRSDRTIGPVKITVELDEFWQERYRLLAARLGCEGADVLGRALSLADVLSAHLTEPGATVVLESPTRGRSILAPASALTGEQPTPISQSSEGGRPAGRPAAEPPSRHRHHSGAGDMSDFDQLIQDTEAEAQTEGGAALAEIGAFDARFTLASALIGRRKELRLTQRELAGASGIPRSEISRIERGQANPTTQTLSRLMRPLGLRMVIVPITAGLDDEVEDLEMAAFLTDRKRRLSGEFVDAEEAVAKLGFGDLLGGSL